MRLDEPARNDRARHPWRVIGAWIATGRRGRSRSSSLLGGSLTTEGAPTNNPESDRALEVEARAFASTSPAPAARSSRPTSSSSARRSDGRLGGVRGGSSRALVRTGRRPRSRRRETYLDGRGRRSCRRTGTRHRSRSRFPGRRRGSRDRGGRGGGRSAAFAVSVTGDQTLDYDFNLLSQEDLEKGELQFGLPAALVILLLVFGAVVAAFVPLVMASVAIIVGARAHRDRRAGVRALDLRRQHAHGDGARAGDRLLAVRRLALSRGTRARPRRAGRHRGVRRDREPGLALQRNGFRRRDVRDAARAELDDA